MHRTHHQIPPKYLDFSPAVCSAWDKGYRFGFNTQEKDDEIAGVGNIYTAEYWEYDSRLGRRWNLDPVDQVWMSNYSVLGNNPLFNNDIFGDRFQPGYSKKQYRKQKRYTKSLINQYKNQLKSLEKDIKYDRRVLKDVNNKLLEEHENEYQNKKSILERSLNELNDALNELTIMNEDQNINFIIVKDKRDKKDEDIYIGGTNKTKDGIVMTWDGSDRGILAHELKHGFQVIACEVGFNDDGSYKAYDLKDEIDAYKRQIVYTEGRTLVFYDDKGLEEVILHLDNLTPENIIKILPDKYKDLPKQKTNVED
ncbi:MAG: hypothetical protein Q8K70_00055 [Bacteroidota bacterium]|nr:hypothetical protein [Bacteroidota bacterium]